jgi:hypothetical protein
VHDQTRRFVDHHDVLVFVEDGEGNRLRQKTGRPRGRNAAGNGIPGLQPMTRLLGPVVDVDVAVRDELGGERARAPRQVGADEYVQPLTGCGRLHKEGKGVAAGHGR